MSFIDDVLFFCEELLFANKTCSFLIMIGAEAFGAAALLDSFELIKALEQNFNLRTFDFNFIPDDGSRFNFEFSEEEQERLLNYVDQNGSLYNLFGIPKKP